MLNEYVSAMEATLFSQQAKRTNTFLLLSNEKLYLIRMDIKFNDLVDKWFQIKSKCMSNLFKILMNLQEFFFGKLKAEGLNINLN